MDSQVERRERRRYASLLAKNIIENELSARQKQILVLYYKEQKTMPEIAQALGSRFHPFRIPTAAPLTPSAAGCVPAI